MEIVVEKAVLHLLDPQADAPVLSDEWIDDEASLGYLGALAAKAYKSEEAKACTLEPDGPGAQAAAMAEDDFAGAAALLARRWFEVAAQNADVPPADAAFVLMSVDGRMHLAGLKLNYRLGWSHYYELRENGAATRLVRQEAMLPPASGKADEAFVIDLSPAKGESFSARAREKKSEVDGREHTSLAARVLGARAGLSPKEKLAAICEAAVEVNRQFYGNLGVEEPEVAAAVCEEYRAQRAAASKPSAPAAAEAGADVGALCEKLYGELPHAREAFEKALREQDIAFDEPLPMPPAGVHRLEKQSLRSAGGVEIRVPVSVYRDENALEFIHNPDGTTSLLIKNVLV